MFAVLYRARTYTYSLRLFGGILSLLLWGDSWLPAQEIDSGYVKKQVSETDLEVLFSYYTQDGEHSAVTGGEGTEHLQVYTPDFRLTHAFDESHRFYASLGVDVISSASTDNIDFHVSSASSLDGRYHMSLGYGQKFPKVGLEVIGKGSVSIESDYFSLGGDLFGSYTDGSQTNTFSLQLQGFFDDLRWGRLNPSTKHSPTKLIYPEELRFREWYNLHDRQSFNASFTWSRVLNRRMILNINPGFSLQQGLLSTPFHRVYFEESFLPKVENLPEQRIKIPLGIGLNSFIGGEWIIRSSYRFYWDDFGILSHTGNIEAPWKVGQSFTLTPFIRFYTQTASDFFQPFGEHSPDEVFYTSDYDLSKFTSIKAGLGVRYYPFASFLKDLSIRYSYYHREDGLYAHILSTYFKYDL
ncbi:MAG: DUF3570 domain-containing protein [Ignavibacteriae bacterium]|nr:DUF3570 domain-containing protein [Ignavibacteriota bacterium]MCB9215789.1 DUF3570 domain-containing protein [Ignavibacteria bacterium]